MRHFNIIRLALTTTLATMSTVLKMCSMFRGDIILITEAKILIFGIHQVPNKLEGVSQWGAWEEGCRQDLHKVQTWGWAVGDRHLQSNNNSNNKDGLLSLNLQEDKEITTERSLEMPNHQMHQLKKVALMINLGSMALKRRIIMRKAKTLTSTTFTQMATDQMQT